MLFAAITTCGNAVKATPVPKPNYTINKEVTVKGSSTYAKSVNVKSGTHVVYRITVASTGNAPVTNLTVKDSLKPDVQYVSGTLKRDGAVASTNFFSTGVLVGTLKNGTSTTFTFEGIVGPKDTPQVCSAETIPNVGSMIATGLPGESSEADVNKACLPKPVFQCTSLTPFQVSRAVFNFTAKANAQNGAVIDSYNFDFGDNTKKVVSSSAASLVTQHSYTKSGTYLITVSVTFTVPGLTGPQTVTDSGCATQVTVKPAPAAECTNLNLDIDKNNQHLATVTATTSLSGGAAVKNVSIDWGDQIVSPNGTKLIASHTYADSVTAATIVATVSFSGSSNVPDSTCQAQFSFTPPTPPVTPPTTLVNTGAGSVVGLFATAATIGAVLYHLVLRRKLSSEA